MFTLKDAEKDYFPFEQALRVTGSNLLEPEETPYQTKSLYKFVLEDYSQSYPADFSFDSWHIKLICDDLEDCVENNLNYCAVLPRLHLKSTICGYAFATWLMLKRPGCNILYISYADGMSHYHTQQIKTQNSHNPILTPLMKDLSPGSDSIVNCEINGKQTGIINGGVYTFKRGTHVSGAVIVDDPLRDPSNPLDYTQVEKVANVFFSEISFIPPPNRHIPIVVFGTPMLPRDLLFQLGKQANFKYRFLPALNPTDGEGKIQRVLWPSVFSEEWILAQKEGPKSKQRAFASELMLAPYLSTDSYITEEEIRRVVNENLVNHLLNRRYDEGKNDEFVVAGFDVGKKVHPSHLTILAKRGNKCVNIHQSFLDGMAYTEQVIYLTDACEKFGVSVLDIDNTRGELEDRGLPRQARLTTFTEKNKRSMAQIFEKYVYEKKLELLNDERFLSQITCVDSDLKAPESPSGHGDSFFSLMLACVAMESVYGESRTQTLGDTGDFVPSEKRDERSLDLRRAFEYTPRAKAVCKYCNESAGLEFFNKLGRCDYEDSEFTRCLICNKSWPTKGGSS